MSERERFIRALKREKIEGRVPTFELVFYLTMEAIRKVHPLHRNFEQWDQMSAHEQALQISDMAHCYTDIAEKYSHSAIFVHPNPGDFENVVRLLETIREISGMKYFICMHGDTTYGIPNGDNMMDFTVRLYEDPEGIRRDQENNLKQMLGFAENLKKRDNGQLLDGFALCADYCFNVNPFFTPEQFHDLIAPTLARTISGYRDLGYYTIKHTDGNIMPIVDQIADCRPDALHSLDPQGGVDLKEMKRQYGNRMCLIGNVNCGLLQTGSEDEVIADTRRALREGMPGYGYIFSTSNCAYTGLALDRYELMHSVWWNEGIYPSEENQ